ncbi:MAG: peptidoglycan-binding domain-containing protein [Candidatus Nanopelagicales bacterium]
MPFPQIRAAGVILLGISLALIPALPTAALTVPSNSSVQSALPVLKYGDKKSAVLRLQVLLGVTPTTGGFFEKTKAAVEQIQRENKLPVTGVVDAATWAVLGVKSAADLKALPKSADETATATNQQIAKKIPRVKPGDDSTAVKRLQVLLGVSPASGRFLTLTRAAVESVQKANGLKVTGVVNAKTWQALGITSFSQFQSLPTSPGQQSSLPVLKYGDKSDAVKKLQILLGVTPVTGGFFDKTRAAVIAVQRAANLSASGSVDNATWQALGILSSAQFDALPTAIVVEQPDSIPEPEPQPEPAEPEPQPEPQPEPTLPIGPVPPGVAPGVPFDAAGEYQAQTICDPNPKTGADRLRQLLKQVYGETTIGIYRDCDRGGTSEHKEGRALDWMYHWRNLEQRAKVEAFLAWLIAPGEDGRPGANARRMGIMYVIWNGRIWGIYRADEGWRDVGGCTTDPAKQRSNYDNYCHRDHVHMSMTWDGAAAMTSYWNPQAQTLAICEESPSAPAPLAVTTPQQLTAITPTRILDTKSGLGVTQPCRLGGKRSVTDNRYLHLPIINSVPVPEITDAIPDAIEPLPDAGIIPVIPTRQLVAIPEIPATGVTAVLLRATVTNSNAPSSISVWARGAAAPSVVTVPVAMGGSASAETIAPVGADGSIAVAVSTGAADVALDVIGYFSSGEQTFSTAPRRSIKLVSTPLLDIRTPLQPGESRVLNLPRATVGDQPQAASVAVSVTAAGAGRVTVSASNQTQLSVRYGATADGVISLRGSRDLTFTNTGNSPATVMVHSNWYLGSDPTAGISGIVPIRPVLAMRSTSVNNTRNAIADLTNISTIPPQATSVLVAVTVQRGLGATGLLIWGGSKPVAPNIGIPSADPRTSLALVSLNQSRTLRATTNSGSANVSMAIVGWGE